MIESLMEKGAAGSPQPWKVYLKAVPPRLRRTHGAVLGLLAAWPLTLIQPAFSQHGRHWATAPNISASIERITEKVADLESPPIA
jgi:hypothetical protein